jgi:two-component system chemotaxis response regulator CheB
MDLNMPRLGGIEATRRIMESTPAPIVVVSSNWSPHEMATMFEAMEAGAVAVLQTPVGIGHPRFDESASQFVETIRLMSGVKVTKRRAKRRAGLIGPSTLPKVMPAPSTNIKLVAIGASLGGPPALNTILMRLEKDFRFPVVICQHIAPGFLQGLVDWLTQTTGFPVHIGTHGESLVPGHAYIAPDAHQMGVAAGHHVALSTAGPEAGLRPAVSYLLRSVGRVYGASAVGVLLTGMGRDGAEELKAMRDGGAVTIAQDQKSSVVHGMPGEAIRLGGAMYVLEPEAIAAMLNELSVAQAQQP